MVYYSKLTSFRTVKVVSTRQRLFGEYFSTAVIILEHTSDLNSTSQFSRNQSNSFITVFTVEALIRTQQRSKARLNISE